MNARDGHSACRLLRTSESVSAFSRERTPDLKIKTVHYEQAMLANRTITEWVGIFENTHELVKIRRKKAGRKLPGTFSYCSGEKLVCS